MRQWPLHTLEWVILRSNLQCNARKYDKRLKIYWVTVREVEIDIFIARWKENPYPSWEGGVRKQIYLVAKNL